MTCIMLSVTGKDKFKMQNMHSNQCSMRPSNRTCSSKQCNWTLGNSKTLRRTPRKM